MTRSRVAPMSPRFPVLLVIVLAGASLAGVVQSAGNYPEAVTWSPTGTGVPIDASIRIEWSMLMETGSVQSAFNMTDGTVLWDWRSFTWSHSYTPPFTSMATPSFPLEPSTAYTVFVMPTATDVTGRFPLDQDGNGIGGEPTDFLAWQFETEDLGPPHVVGTLPGDGATSVPVSTNVDLWFDEAMDTASVEAALEIEPAVLGTFAWDLSGTQVSFDPGLNLAFGTTYTVRVNGTVAKDVGGNPLDGNGDGDGGDDYTFSFTTEPDTGPPRVIELAPPPGTMGASVTANVEVRFSETMNRSSVMDAFSYTDGTSTWNATAGGFSWRGVVFVDDVAVFNPFVNFAFARTFTITLNASVARDVSGFTLDGDADGISESSPTDDVAWSFTTEATDTTPPEVAAISPPNGATDVPETAAIELTFSEAMDRASVEAAFSLSDGVRTWTGADGWFGWSAGNDVVVYTPATNLKFARLHTVTLAGTIARDVNGNVLDGDADGVGGDDFSATFTTRAQPDTVPPHVVSTIPKDGATDVERAPAITITFDDAMNREATEAAISLANVSTPETMNVAIGSFQWSAADHTVSFQPLVPLDWDTSHEVTVSQAARDDAGLALEVPFTFSFRTAAWTGRVIGRVVDGAAAVAGAMVALGEQTTQTTSTGAFEFPGVAAGAYNLTISKAGYETTRLALDLDHADAGPDAGTIDLGAISLRRLGGFSPVLVLGVLLAALAGAIALGLLLRRRRVPPWEHLADVEEEAGEARR